MCSVYWEPDAGIILLKVNDDIFATKFSKTKLKADKSGRLKPIICDFCFTRLPGSKVSRISCIRKSDNHSFSWLICSSLNCSLNTRELTKESLESKQLIGETVSVSRKIKRLQAHIEAIVETLELKTSEGIFNE